MKNPYLTLIVLILFVTLSTQTLGNESPPETWQCAKRTLFGEFLESKIVVRLTQDHVSINGISHPAQFSIVGFDRRWDFGDHAFVIDIDGDGGYYDFSNLSWWEKLMEKRVGPSATYICREGTHKN